MSERLDGLLDDFLVMGYGKGFWDEAVPDAADRADAWFGAVMRPQEIIVLPLEDSVEAQLVRDFLSLDFDGAFSPALLRLMEDLGIAELIFLTGGDEVSRFDVAEMAPFEDVPLVENASQ